MKILVTGKNGQVGSALIECAKLKENIEIEAFGSSDLDITNWESVVEALSSVNPDVVINGAAYTAVDKAEDDAERAYLVNKDGSRNLAEACAKKNIPLLHISTDFVFDGTKIGAYEETDTCHPLGVYGKSKWEGEIAVQENCPKHLIMRTAWVFGGAQNFVNTMRRLATTHPAISVVDDQRGGPTAAIDIALSLLLMAERATSSDFDGWGVYHYAGGPSVSWYEFACEILKDHDSVLIKPIPTSGYPTPASRPANSVLDCRKIKSVFDIDQPEWSSRL